MSCNSSIMKKINKGNTPLSEHTFTYDDGSVVSLTHITAADLKMYIVDEDNEAKEGTGDWNITNAAGGIATYLFSVEDTSDPGEKLIYTSVPLPGELVARDFDPQKILITNYPKPD